MYQEIEVSCIRDVVLLIHEHLHRIYNVDCSVAPCPAFRIIFRILRLSEELDILITKECIDTTFSKFRTI